MTVILKNNNTKPILIVVHLSSNLTRQLELNKNINFISFNWSHVWCLQGMIVYARCPLTLNKYTIASFVSPLQISKVKYVVYLEERRHQTTHRPRLSRLVGCQHWDNMHVSPCCIRQQRTRLSYTFPRTVISTLNVERYGLLPLPSLV